MRTWVQFCAVITMLATCVAWIFILTALLTTGISAPQQAAQAAIGCGVAIIPYVFTRCFDVWQRGNELAEIRNLLESKPVTPSPLTPPQIITPAELLASANALIKAAQADRRRNE